MNTTTPKPVLMRQAAGSRSIGAILVDSGRLSLADAERILALQHSEGLRFGEAGLRLGALKPEDITFALARQYDYPYLLPGESKVSLDLVAAYSPFSPQVEALRALRSQLMLRWFTGGKENRVLAITSTGRGEGRSWLAANLAVVFSQLGERTLLVDADLRNASQHALFGLQNRAGLTTILSDRGQSSLAQRVPAFLDLSVLPAGPMPPNPQELLARPTFTNLLDELANDYSVVLIDTPAADHCADAHAIARLAGGALIVARQDHSSLDATTQLATTLADLGVTLVGATLNQF